LIEKAKKQGITMGIHYEPLHKMELFTNNIDCELPLSEAFNKISIPFHENLTYKEIKTVISFINANI
jgi:dTDP-4-amino-4,6-dideoxygalactose transaminase